MQLEEECKNMENNKVFFKFLKENEELSLNLWYEPQKLDSL